MHEHDSVLEGMTLSAVDHRAAVRARACCSTTAPARSSLAMLWALARRRRGDVRDGVGDGRSPQRDDRVPVRDRHRQRHQRRPDPRRRATSRSCAPASAIRAPRSARAMAGALRGTLAATATAAVAYALAARHRLPRLPPVRRDRRRRHGADLAHRVHRAAGGAVRAGAPRRDQARARRPRVGARARRACCPSAGSALVHAARRPRSPPSRRRSPSVYIARDPFTHDWRDLQSSTPAIRERATRSTRSCAAASTPARCSPARPTSS